MKKVFLFLFLFVSPLYAQSELTLEDAIRMGLEQNYDIQIARNSAEMAQNNRGLGRSGFLPTLNVSSNYQRTIAGGDGDDSQSWGSKISLAWTIFDGFGMFITRDKYNELAKLGDIQARNTIENIVVAISRAYFDLVQQEQLFDINQDALAISETRLNKEKIRNELGGASSTDLLNAQVAYNTDRAALINQELQVKIARQNLNLLLGQDPQTPLIVKKEIAIIPLNETPETLLTLAKEQNSTLKMAEYNKTIAEQNQQLARTTFYPRVIFNGSYGYSDRIIYGDYVDITTKSTEGIVGISLSYSIFNGYRDQINWQNAKIEVKNKTLLWQDAHNQIEGFVLEKYEKFQNQMELIVLEEENVMAARQNLRLQEDRYQIGTATSLEFRDAQVNLIHAQTILIIARFQARMTYLEIQQLIGQLNLK